MSAPLHLVRSFGPNELLAVEYRGQPVLLAGQMGAALGYADPKTLTSNISQKWADEFAVGRDFFRLEGEELSAFKDAMSSWCADRAPAVHPFARSLLLLTERGAYLAAALSRTPVGAAFRAWVVDDLLPAWRAAQAAAAPPVPEQLAVFDRVRVRELRLLANSYLRAGGRPQAGYLLGQVADQLLGPGVLPPLPDAAPMTMEEKRAVVRSLLERVGHLSSREIAAMAGVSHTFVDNMRRGIQG